MSASRTYLNVPYSEKDQAKGLGARWDPDQKKWYVPEGKNLEPFNRWYCAEVAQIAAAKAPQRAGEAGTAIAVTQPTGSGFVAYSGDAPPWN